MPFIIAEKENERESESAGRGICFDILTCSLLSFSLGNCRHLHSMKTKAFDETQPETYKEEGKKETYLLCARVLIGADQSLSRGSILKQNIALFSQFTRQNHPFTGLFFSHVQDSWQIRRRSSSAQCRRMSSIPTGSLARGSSSDCNRLPSRESSWATTPSRPSWGWGLNHDAALLTNVVNLCFLFPSRNFASSAPNAAFSGATIGSPSPWCTPR